MNRVVKLFAAERVSPDLEEESALPPDTLVYKEGGYTTAGNLRAAGQQPTFGQSGGRRRTRRQKRRRSSKKRHSRRRR